MHLSNIFNGLFHVISNIFDGLFHVIMIDSKVSMMLKMM